MFEQECMCVLRMYVCGWVGVVHVFVGLYARALGYTVGERSNKRRRGNERWVRILYY